MSISPNDIFILLAVVVGGIAIAALSNWIQNREDKGKNGKNITD
jgi:hypothetical protein